MRSLELGALGATVFDGKLPVCTGRRHDLLLSALADQNERHAGSSAMISEESFRVHAFFDEPSMAGIPARVVPDPADEGHSGPEPRCSDGLIGPLAARRLLEFFTFRRFSG